MKLLSIFAFSAFLFGFGANLSAHHEDGERAMMDDGSSCPLKHFHHLKMKVFKHILLKNGVDKETAHEIMADVHHLKMKIKHKLKRILKAELQDRDGDEYGHHKCGHHHWKKMFLKKLLTKHGVSEETADNVFHDIKALKMKIMHKIKHILMHSEE
jgi:hypothetical protein